MDVYTVALGHAAIIVVSLVNLVIAWINRRKIIEVHTKILNGHAGSEATRVTPAAVRNAVKARNQSGRWAEQP